MEKKRGRHGKTETMEPENRTTKVGHRIFKSHPQNFCKKCTSCRDFDPIILKQNNKRWFYNPSAVLSLRTGVFPPVFNFFRLSVPKVKKPVMRTSNVKISPIALRPTAGRRSVFSSQALWRCIRHQLGRWFNHCRWTLDLVRVFWLVFEFQSFWMFLVI